MVKSDEHQKKMIADMNRVVLEESEEEKMLWEKRTLLEKKIEKKMKMIHNGRERLDCGGRIGVFERVEEEIGMMQEDIGRIRDEIALVDRKIRVAERKEMEERREEAEGVDWVAKEAKEYADALGQARQRMEAEVQYCNVIRSKLDTWNSRTMSIVTANC
jgi:hypothetical protein